MKVEAFKLSQWGNRGIVEIYSCVFRARDLVDNVQYDRWGPKNYGGYQRETSSRRLGLARGSVLRYLMKEHGVFPTSILINARGNVSFDVNKPFEWYSSGMLELDKKNLWVIDGQHRIEALKLAMTRNKDFDNYPVITSIVKLPDRFDEMLLFYIINRRQRGIKTDLAYRHLQRMLWQKGEEWILDLEGKQGLDKSYSVEIVDLLNNEPMSPWNGRVRSVGEPRLSEHLIEDNQMSSTILPLLKDAKFKGMPIKEIAWYLVDFWNALYRLFPECFNSPRDYTLLKKPGIHSMHKLFHEIVTKDEDIDEELLYQRLRYLTKSTPDHSIPEFRPGLVSDFWSLEKGPDYVKSARRVDVEELFGYLNEKLWLASP